MDNPYLLLIVLHGSTGTIQLKGQSDGTVGDLRKEVSKWCGVPTEDQRFTVEGLPLPWEVDLSCVGKETTLKVASRKDEDKKLAFPVQDGI